jgi:chromosome segregation ATPase
MKKFLSNLLIVFSLGLCAMAAFQWVREAKLRDQIQSLTTTVEDKDTAIAALETTLKNTKAEVVRLEGIRTDLTETIKTNRQEIVTLSRKSDRLENELDVQKRQSDVYKEALDQANENIKRQNEDIKRQNEDLKKLVEERNESIMKFNKLAGDYNTLVKDFNKLQEDYVKVVEAANAAVSAANAQQQKK